MGQEQQRRGGPGPRGSANGTGSGYALLSHGELQADPCVSPGSKREGWVASEEPARASQETGGGRLSAGGAAS